MVVTNPASQIVAALVVGLLIALTCQLLLTNLGLAVGITIWGGWAVNGKAADDGVAKGDNVRDDSGEGKSSAVSLGALSLAAGLGLLLTVNGVLFLACYAAVRFCAPMTTFSGGVLGLVIWSAYLLTMTWVSSRAANSLVAFVLSSAVSGLRTIFDALSAVMQPVFDGSESPMTPTAMAELVRQETQTAFDQVDIPALIETYIDDRMASQISLETLQTQIEQTLQQSDLARPEHQGLLPQLDLTAFARWVKDDLGLGGTIAAAIANQLYQSWQRVTETQSGSLQPLLDLFAHGSVEDLTLESVSHSLSLLSPEQLSSKSQGEPAVESESEPQESRPKPHQSAVDGIHISHRLRQVLRQRIDLTDLDVETIWERISPLLEQHPGGSTSAGRPNGVGPVIHEDVDDYLRQVAPWRLANETLQQEFRDVLIDSEAAVEPVLTQVRALTPADFIHSLEQRGDLAQAQIEAIAARLDRIRQAAIADLAPNSPNGPDSGEGDGDIKTTPETTPEVTPEATPAQQATLADLQQNLENYLHYTSLSQITPTAIDHKMKTLVDEASLSAAVLHHAMPHLPTDALKAVLGRRQGLKQGQQDRLIQQVQEAWQQQTRNPSQRPETQQQQTTSTDSLKSPRRWALRRTADANDFWSSLEEYLIHGGPDQLSPAAISQNLAWLWRISSRGTYALQGISTEAVEAIQSFDWTALKASLSRRQDLTTDQVNAIWSAVDLFIAQLLTQVDQARQQVHSALESWFESVKTMLQDPDHLAFDPNSLKRALRELLSGSPDSLPAFQPLELLKASEGVAAAIARFSQDALSQVLKAQGVPDALLDQAAGLKDWIQERVAWVEQEIRDRQAALEQAALQQLNDTRKALAAAAWWLFAIAVTSATTAVGAGLLAVVGVDSALNLLLHLLPL